MVSQSFRTGGGLYKIGDKVVYPHHGAGKVVKREKREVLGEKREYLTIKIDHNDMTVNVPSENADKVGLRKVIGEDMVKTVLKALTGGGTQMPKNWNRRFKHNRDKMKTGDILELAEVVRNLALRDHEKGLSTGEKQMYVKAKKILASELMYAKSMDEEEIAEWLDGVLTASGPNGEVAAGNGASKKKATVAGATAAKAVARPPTRVAVKPAPKAAAKPKAAVKPKAAAKSAPKRATRTVAKAAKKPVAKAAKKTVAKPAAKAKAKAKPKPKARARAAA